MFIAFVLFLIFNIVFTLDYFLSDKKNKKWLNDAKEAYSKNEFTSEYPRSEIAIKKTNYKYDMRIRFLISSWIILFVCPFVCEVKIYIMIYIANYLFSRVLSYLSVLEQKIDAIKDEVYKENEYL